MRAAHVELLAIADDRPVGGGGLDALESGMFSPDDPARFQDLTDRLRHRDHFMVCADFEAYRSAQRSVDDLWRRPADWWRCAIVNTANVGWFSADRAIREYAGQIWNVAPRLG